MLENQLLVLLSEVLVPDVGKVLRLVRAETLGACDGPSPEFETGAS